MGLPNFAAGGSISFQVMKQTSALDGSQTWRVFVGYGASVATPVGFGGRGGGIVLWPAPEHFRERFFNRGGAFGASLGPFDAFKHPDYGTGAGIDLTVPKVGTLRMHGGVNPTNPANPYSKPSFTLSFGTELPLHGFDPNFQAGIGFVVGTDNKSWVDVLGPPVDAIGGALFDFQTRLGRGLKGEGFSLPEAAQPLEWFMPQARESSTLSMTPPLPQAPPLLQAPSASAAPERRSVLIPEASLEPLKTSSWPAVDVDLALAFLPSKGT